MIIEIFKNEILDICVVDTQLNNPAPVTEIGGNPPTATRSSCRHRDRIVIVNHFGCDYRAVKF